MTQPKKLKNPGKKKKNQNFFLETLKCNAVNGHEQSMATRLKGK